MTNLELQIQRTSINIDQVRSIRAYLTSIDRPKLAEPLWDAENLLIDYRNLLKAQLKTQDPTDPTWHDN